MIHPLAAAVFAAQFAVAAADGVPVIDYEKSCRAEPAADASLGITVDTQSVSSCMAEEKNARDQLVAQWEQYPPTDRVHCEREAQLGQMPSYVEMQTCLMIARETKSLPPLQSFIKARK